jgi:hypothetical protein
MRSSGTPRGIRSNLASTGPGLKEVMESITPANHNKTGTAVCAGRDGALGAATSPMGVTRMAWLAPRDGRLKDGPVQHAAPPIPVQQEP